MALWKKEMKVVKCNTRKVLLTRHRSSHPPALSLQLPPPFLFTSHPSTNVEELRNWRTWYSTEHKEFIPKPRGGNKGDLKGSPEVPTLPQSHYTKRPNAGPRTSSWAAMAQFSVIRPHLSIQVTFTSPPSPTIPHHTDLHTHSSHTHTPPEGSQS